MTVTASRELVDRLCADHDIPLLVVHDFDKAGFSIVGTLMRDTRRYSFRNRIHVIDLGLRLDDVEGLERETVYSDVSVSKVRANLRENGATQEEIEFLLSERVELNAFASDELITWIEAKLEEHGVKKVVPDVDTLDAAYQRMRKQAIAQKHIDKLIAGMDEDDTEAPDDLSDRVADRLEKDPALAWDAAMREIVVDEIGDEGGAE